MQDSESLFRNETALDPFFTPRGPIEFRENENKYIAQCIKPLLQRRSGKNLIIYGPPGIGKTLACKKVLEQLEEEPNEIIPFYVNVWKKNSQYKIILELCEQLDYKFTHNKSADDLFEVVKQKINQKSSIFILDEIDKAESTEILYSLIEDIYRKTIILITNDKNWIYKLDLRLKSRLIPDNLEFREYKLDEIKSILKSRAGMAFPIGALHDNVLDLISKKTKESSDIRTGLFLLRESALIAESSLSKKIMEDHVKQAINKLTINNESKLDVEEEKLFDTIKKNPDKTTKEIFEIYKKEEGKAIRTFQKKLKSLEKAELIEKEEIKGIHGKSFKIKPKETKLSDF